MCQKVPMSSVDSASVSVRLNITLHNVNHRHNLLMYKHCYIRWIPVLMLQPFEPSDTLHVLPLTNFGPWRVGEHEICDTTWKLSPLELVTDLLVVCSTLSLITGSQYNQVPESDAESAYVLTFGES